MIPLICFYVVVKLFGLTQLNILASYLSLVNSFQVMMVLFKENFISSCLFVKGRNQKELLELQILESYCLPLLNYCTVAVKLSIFQTVNLNAC